MADTALCVTRDCLDRLVCLRYRARSRDPWQPYSDFRPDPKTGRCASFAPVPAGPRDLLTIAEADNRR